LPQIAIPTGSVIAGWYVDLISCDVSSLTVPRIMRKTDKLYTLTLVSSFTAVFASLMATQWSERTSSLHLWLDLIPQGLGVASFITSTLIVGYFSYW